MKTSTIASLLFGTLAIAAPLEKRRYVTKTSVVVQTEVVYVTVYEGQAPVAAPTTTSTPGLFYEHPPKSSSSSAAVPTSTSTSSKKEEPAYTPPAPKPSSSSSTSTPPPAPTSVYTPPPPPPAPTTSAYVAPAPSSSSPAAPAPSSPSGGQPSGQTYTGDITIYDNTGAAGACGKSLTDDMMICAMAKPVWGESTYDVMTGDATNPWCGKEITLEYEGNQITCTVMDLCPVCAYGDVDLSLSAWKALTGLDEKTRKKATWWANN